MLELYLLNLGEIHFGVTRSRGRRWTRLRRPWRSVVGVAAAAAAPPPAARRPHNPVPGGLLLDVGVSFVHPIGPQHEPEYFALRCGFADL